MVPLPHAPPHRDLSPALRADFPLSHLGSETQAGLSPAADCSRYPEDEDGIEVVSDMRRVVKGWWGDGDGDDDGDEGDYGDGGGHDEGGDVGTVVPSVSEWSSPEV